MKGKNKTVKTLNLSSWDGVKEVVVHKASVENRRERNFSKDNKAVSKDERMEDDVVARRDRFGYYF